MAVSTIKSGNIAEAMVEAGHNFEVATAKVQYDVDETNPLSNNILTDDEHKVIYRTDTGKALGCMGKKYSHSQPSHMWAMADALTEASGGRIKTALTIDKGRMIGIGIELEKQEYILNDPIVNGFMLMDSFDGSQQFSARIRSIRLVCSNGMTVRGRHEMFSIRHSGKMEEKIAEALRMITWYQNNMEVFNMQMKLIADTKMTHKQAVEWFTRLFPEPNTDRSKTLLQNKVDKFEYLLEKGHGTDIKGVKGTQYWALNAMTEYVNHHSTFRVSQGRSRDDVRVESLLVGSANKLIQKGFSSLLSA